MLRAAAQGYFHSRPDHEMKGRFESSLNLATNFSPRRNEIAHGIVTVAFYQVDSGKEFLKLSLEESLKAQRWLLCPPEYATNKNVLIPLAEQTFGRTRRKYAYSCKEVNHYQVQFTQLRRDLWQLTLDWWDRYPDEGILPPV